MQWKQMDWPVLVDSLNLLGVEVVPLTILIDERGIVRSARARLSDLEEFVEGGRAAGAIPLAPPADRPSLDELASRAEGGGDSQAGGDYGDGLILWGGPEQATQAIQAYRKILERNPGHGPTHFRLGVAYRKRYDSAYRQEGDFSKAVDHWGRALEINPNQYIWRRRIQQYGPRLDKPYPFYDWVVQARKDIQQRGESPAPLLVEPGGAEFADPARSFETVRQAQQNPDPQGRIRRDDRFVRLEATLVPSRLAAGRSGRVHVVMRPDLSRKAHWNNEAEDLVLWVDPPPGWQVDSQYHSLPRPRQPVSQEERRVEFELRCPEGFSGTATVPAYVLYYVCEDVDGTCLYRRQDLEVQVQAEQK
ncbi:MAG: hypothetical protein V3T83_12980, partial [Acidobacteriota bacterium]